MITELLSGAVHADSAENMGGLVFDRIPKPRVSAMDNLLTGFNFIVSLNEFTYGFQNVSNIQRHREVVPIPEGGVNDHQILVGRPNDNFYTLSLRRGYIIHGPDDLVNKVAVAGIAHIPNEMARRTALIAINSSSPQAALENGPSLGFIQVYSRQKKLVAMFSFLSLGMTEWTLSDLDAQSSEALFENITIAHTGLTLLPATWLPSITQPIMGWAGETEDSMATMTAIVEKNKEEFEKRQKKLKELEKKKKELDEARIGFLHERDKILKKRAEKAETAGEKADAGKTKEKAALENMAKRDEITKQRDQALKDKMKEIEDDKNKDQEELDSKREAEREKISEQYKARQEAQAEALKEQDEKQKAAREQIKNRDETTQNEDESPEDAGQDVEGDKNTEGEEGTDNQNAQDNAQDKENVGKVEQSNKAAQDRMNSENNEK